MKDKDRRVIGLSFDRFNKDLYDYIKKQSKKRRVTDTHVTREMLRLAHNQITGKKEEEE